MPEIAMTRIPDWRGYYRQSGVLSVKSEPWESEV